jgi:hypothetical protein
MATVDPMISYFDIGYIYHHNIFYIIQNVKHQSSLGSILYSSKCWTTQSSKPDRFFATGSLSCIPASHKTWLARKSHVASRFRWFSQPFGGFLKWSYPQSCIYRWIFHHKPTSYWGTPIYGNLHIYMADHFCLFEIPSCLDFLIMYMCIYI